MTVEALTHFLGSYRHGSLFRKLKKTWVQLGLSKNEDVIDCLDFVELKKTWDHLGLNDEEQNKILFPIEKRCMYMCLAFLNKKNKDTINTKQIKTSPSLGCSRTSMSVNEAHNNLCVEYNPGSLLRKLKIKWLQLKNRRLVVEIKDGLDFVELEKTWVQLGQSDEGQMLLFDIEKECLYNCVKFFNKEIICRMDKIQTKPRLGCSGTSVAVNEARNNLYGEYSSGSLLRKLKKTFLQLGLDIYEEGLDFMELKEVWDRLGLSEEEQNTRLLQKETECLCMYMEFFKKKYIIGMKNFQTKTRVGFSGTSMPHQPLLGEYSCGSLLRKLKKTSLQLGLDKYEGLDFMELKKKWVKCGRSDEEQTVFLLKIEKQCLRKCSKFFKKELFTYLRRESQLEKDLRDAQLEISTLSSVLGVVCSAEIPDNTLGTIKDLVEDRRSMLKELRKQKRARKKEFLDVLSQIHNISGEIAGFLNLNDDVPTVDEYDLSHKKLEGYKSWLQKLQNEKRKRLQKVSKFVNTVQHLCAVLGMDSSSTIADVHPSLNTTDAQPKNLSISTLASLDNTVLKLKNYKKQRLHKLKELASRLNHLWNQMDTPLEERNLFDNFTCNISASVDEVTTPGALALDLIKQAEEEVERLESRMKENSFKKKQAELEEAASDKTMLLIDSGCIEQTELHVDIDKQTAKEALSREDMLDEVEKLMSALKPYYTLETIKDKNHEDIMLVLEELKKLKDERRNTISDLLSEIYNIHGEFIGIFDHDVPAVFESDLSQELLEEYQSLVEGLTKEKEERLQKVSGFVKTVHQLCVVLGKDSFSTLAEIHPSLNDSSDAQSKSISDNTLARLDVKVVRLTKDKKRRLRKLKELAFKLINLWNLMDTPPEERNLFENVTCNISASIDEVITPGALALGLIKQAEVEVERLESRMKEIALKKQAEFEEAARGPKAARDKTVTLINSGCIEQTELHVDIDDQTVTEALCGEDLFDEVNKLIPGCDECVAGIVRNREESCAGIPEKQAELEEAARGPKAARDKTVTLINSGCIEQTELHVDIDDQTVTEALCGEDLFDEVNKLMPGCDECVAGIVRNREESCAGIPEITSGTIMKKFNAAFDQLFEELRQPKEVRIDNLSDQLSQIHNISGEIDESGLSQTKLEGYQSWFQKLQTDKKERLQKVSEFVNTVHDLCAVLGMDSSSTLAEVNPSLNDSTDAQSESISNATLARLADTVLMLKENKKQRLHKLKELASKLINLWNLMDSPPEERNLFDNVTCNISASIDEVTTPGALALGLIKQAEVEVERLESRIKEIAFKKQAELEEAARDKTMTLINSGCIEQTELHVDIDNQTATETDNQMEKAKKDALSRKDILDLVRSWLSACEEERWLEDYYQDENRYNRSRGANLNMDEEERAKEARILVNKIPDMVDTLVTKTRTWEETHNIPFTYDSGHLLDKLNNYAMLRNDREKRSRRAQRKKSDKQQSTGDRKRDKTRCWAPFFCGAKSMPGSPQ